MFLIPSRPGLVVRDPQTKRLLPDTGAEIPESSPHISFWIRRISAGDVIQISAPIPDSKEQEQCHDSFENTGCSSSALQRSPPSRL